MTVKKKNIILDHVADHLSVNYCFHDFGAHITAWGLPVPSSYTLIIEG